MGPDLSIKQNKWPRYDAKFSIEFGKNSITILSEIHYYCVEENKYDDHGALAFFSISEKLITFSNEEVSSPSFSHFGYINAQNA